MFGWLKNVREYIVNPPDPPSEIIDNVCMSLKTGDIYWALRQMERLTDEEKSVVLERCGPLLLPHLRKSPDGNGILFVHKAYYTKVPLTYEQLGTMMVEAIKVPGQLAIVLHVRRLGFDVTNTEFKAHAELCIRHLYFADAQEVCRNMTSDGEPIDRYRECLTACNFNNLSII